EPGEPVVSAFVVRSGRIEILRPLRDMEQPIASLAPGQFTGETNMISGRRSLVRVRVAEPGQVIELQREQLLSLVQRDVELGEIMLRAFILRRVELIAHGLGDAVLVGSVHCAGTLRLKEFLTRNGHPYTYLDLDRDEG